MNQTKPGGGPGIGLKNRSEASSKPNVLPVARNKAGRAWGQKQRYEKEIDEEEEAEG
jgi:hypothetical protein